MTKQKAPKKYKVCWFSEADDEAYASANMRNIVSGVQSMEWFAGSRPDLVYGERKKLREMATRLQKLARDPEEFYRQRQAKMAEI